MERMRVTETGVLPSGGFRRAVPFSEIATLEISKESRVAFWVGLVTGVLWLAAAAVAIGNSQMFAFAPSTGHDPLTSLVMTALVLAGPALFLVEYIYPERRLEALLVSGKRVRLFKSRRLSVVEAAKNEIETKQIT